MRRLIVASCVVLALSVGIAAQDRSYDGFFVGSDTLPSRSLDGLNPILPSTGKASAQRPIVYVNGVQTTFDSQKSTMRAIADQSGQPVIGIHNATSGISKTGGAIDVVQATSDYFSLITNPATQSLARYIYDKLKSPDGDLYLIGHSQGTIIINNAIKVVKNTLERDGSGECQVLSKLARIKVEAYGSPVFDFVTGPAYYHSCNYSDWVVCNQGGRRWLKDQAIILQKSSSTNGKSKAEGEVYGGNAVVDNFNTNTALDPIDSHSIGDVYLGRRASAHFNPPPSCQATLFLMDTSGSMANSGKWDGALQSALYSLKALDDETKTLSEFYPTAVLSFAGECNEGSTKKLFEFTTDIERISAELPRKLPRPGGETPLFISLDAAWKVMDDFTAKNPGVWGSMIFLTDGQDTCGGYLRPSSSYSTGPGASGGSSLLGEKRKNTRVFTVGYDIAPGSRGERDLQYMAFAGGGKYYNAANPRQLQRAFQKLTQTYYPRNITLNDSQRLQLSERINAAGTALQKKRAVDALKLYRQLEGEFTKSSIKSADLDFNIAQALEANDLYRGAADYYQRYLQTSPGAPDKVAVERKISQLREDYRDQFDYYLKILDSDLQYLKAYYKDLFNKRNDALAAEFAGFVSEKGAFYTNLAMILEVKAKWLENGSKDLSESLYNLSDRVSKPSFDRDAVSLLTLPISQLEELLDQLNQNKNKLIN